MYTVQYGGKGGKKISLEESNALIAVRTRSRNMVMGGEDTSSQISPAAMEILSEFESIEQFPNYGVEVFQVRESRRPKTVRDAARTALKKEPSVHFAGRVLVDPKSQTPVVYTENAFVKFVDDCKAAHAKQLLKKYGFTSRRMLKYARNAYTIAAPDGVGLEIFDLVARLFEEDAVELLHPELVRRAARKGAFANQWHLRKSTINGKVIDQHAGVEAAWSLADGNGVTIAIIDDGVDLDHEEFRSSGKIIAPRDVTLGSDNPRPGFGDRHGTACAGVACADGSFGASGVAPKARLIPIRLASGLGSQAEADAFVHAAQNGADVISCSWGPEDGRWWDPNDPKHNLVVPIPDSTRLAIDFATTQGRNGKGCVVLFAAGNGNEPVENDGYASYSKVIAVAAVNDMGVKSAYSDFGKAVWCAFPSNDTVEPRPTSGIWTTDNSGNSGYNPGQTTKGDAAGNYTNSFGGTSSACPGAAGVAALVLSRNNNLRWDEVREILKNSCDKIDSAGGAYDAEGRSAKYGFGRLNARKAVELAMPVTPVQDRVVVVTARKDVAIRDLSTASLPVDVAETGAAKKVTVTVDIEHTYIGDLNVSLTFPPASKVKPIVLHKNTGGGTDNLRVKYDAINTPALAGLVGKKLTGRWTLVVKDMARLDTGKIKAITVEITV
jgi:subtilisin family serine protease